MPEIQRLDADTSSKIAAGEVVDRPLNVVKELVENSVDAGASKITIDLSEGGIKSITVTDDGKGIPFDELPLAVERFATSKARRVEDVYNIGTYGFRGEALAAVSAVSNFTLKSIREGSPAGEVSVRFGAISKVKPSPISKGTQVTVDNIFDNLPVRKKFLKSQRSNEGEILRFLKHFSMVNPGVEIVINFDNKEVYRTFSANTSLDLAKNVFGEDRVMQGEYSSDKVSVNVCVAHPVIQRKRRDAIYIGVNGRVVKDAPLVQAVIQAYHRLIPANAFPAALIDLRIDPSLVDVNIHPTKSEVRFDVTRSSELFSAVLRACETALQKFTAAVYAEDEENLNSGQVETPRLTVAKAGLTAEQQADPFLKSTPLSVFTSDKPAAREPAHEYKATQTFNITDEFKSETVAAVTQAVTETPAPQVDLESFTVIGQLNNTYIICKGPSNSEGMGDLVVIDQHVAHERVLYEKYLNERMNAAPSITLFEPVVITVTGEEAEIFEDMADELARFGYGYENFGPQDIKVTRVPVDKLKKDTRKELMGIVHDAMDNRKSRSQDYAIVTMSCKNAVKAGDPLSNYELQQLVDALMKTQNPHTCPHGRPIIFNMPLGELNKKFHR